MSDIAQMSADELNDIANRHLQEGRLAEALHAYARLCDLQPGNASAWHMQAAVSGMVRQFENTARCCEKALAIAPNAAAVYANYASALIELGRHEEAVRAFQQAIRLDPADASSLANLANLHRLLNNLAEAEKCFRRVTELVPNNTEASSRLAHILKETGGFREAIDICERTLSAAPMDRTILTTLLECCFSIGATDDAYRHIVAAMPVLEHLETPLYAICWRLHANKRYAEDISAIQTVLKLFPEQQPFKLILADCQIQTNACEDAIRTLSELDEPLPCEAHLMLARAYQKIEQRDLAVEQLATACSAYPDDENAVALLARSLIESGNTAEARLRLEAFLDTHADSARILVELGSIHELESANALAERCYKQAIACKPDYAIAYSRLGVLYQNSATAKLARECFEKAIQCDPALLVAKCNLAYLCCSGWEYRQALDHYNEVIEADPDCEQAIAGKAIVLERLGDASAALQLVEPLVERGTEDMQTLIAYAVSSSGGNKEKSAIALLESALERPGILPAIRLQSHFVLGKLLDRVGEFDRAFANYEQGNRLNPSPFDRDAHERLIDAMVAVFSSDNMKRFPRASCNSDKLVFIIGMPRSGTTLTEQILEALPEVFGAGELHHIRDIAAAIPGALGSKRPFPLDLSGISQETLERFASEHVAKLHAMANGETWITDKMPSNFMFLGLIELLFPDARILHCVRNPMDTCLSCYFQNFSQGQYFSYRQSDLAFYYRQYQRIMAHWKRVLNIPILDVHYEELVSDQERTSRQMLEFIGLDWNADCLDFHKSKRIVRTASYSQVRNPVYRNSVERWKNYEQHLSELKKALDEPAVTP